jgi:hypothetical protein
MGFPLYVSDGYRTFAEQVVTKVKKGSFAATPGTSNHGLGVAVDLASGINSDNSASHHWMEAHGPDYGWANPWWAVDHIPSNGQYEPWHWEYNPNNDKRPAFVGAPTQEVPDMLPNESAALTANTAQTAAIYEWMKDGNFTNFYLIRQTLTAIQGALTAVLKATGVDEAALAALLVPVLVPAIVAALPDTTPMPEGVGLSVDQVQAAAEAAIKSVLGSLDGSTT